MTQINISYQIVLEESLKALNDPETFSFDPSTAITVGDFLVKVFEGRGNSLFLEGVSTRVTAAVKKSNEPAPSFLSPSRLLSDVAQSLVGERLLVVLPHNDFTDIFDDQKYNTYVVRKLSESISMPPSKVSSSSQARYTLIRHDHVFQGRAVRRSNISGGKDYPYLIDSLPVSSSLYTPAFNQFLKALNSKEDQFDIDETVRAVLGYNLGIFSYKESAIEKETDWNDILVGFLQRIFATTPAFAKLDFQYKVRLETSDEYDLTMLF